MPDGLYGRIECETVTSHTGKLCSACESAVCTRGSIAGTALPEGKSASENMKSKQLSFSMTTTSIPTRCLLLCTHGGVLTVGVLTWAVSQ